MIVDSELSYSNEDSKHEHFILILTFSNSEVPSKND